MSTPSEVEPVAVSSWHSSSEEEESPSEKNLELEVQYGYDDLEVKDETVSVLKVADEKVSTSKVADENVSVSKIADEKVPVLKVEDEKVPVSKAADEKASVLKVANETVSVSKVADENVSVSEVADENVSVSKVADEIVSVLKVKDETVSVLKVEDENVSVLKVKDEKGCDLKAKDGGKSGKEESPPDYDSDDWETWPNKDVFIKYYQQLRESDGFDFDEYPGSCLFAPIYPILGFERYPEFVDKIKGYATMAMKKYFRKRNHKKERYVKEIVKINGGGPRDFNFYITFKIDNEGKEETFQAQVVSTIEDTIEIPICRRKKM